MEKTEDSTMSRLLLITISILCSVNTFAAKGMYQIDLILFAQPQSDKSSIGEPNLPVISSNKNVILLTPDSNKSFSPYKLLPPSQSSLRDENYLLNRKSHYKVLSHYSWRQTANSKSTIALPEISVQGWQIQGTVNISQSNYYLFNTNLQCSSPAHPDRSFTVTQKQRLQGNLTYYLDHQDLGMLVKIHKIT